MPRTKLMNWENFSDSQMTRPKTSTSPTEREKLPTEIPASSTPVEAVITGSTTPKPERVVAANPIHANETTRRRATRSTVPAVGGAIPRRAAVFVSVLMRTAASTTSAATQNAIAAKMRCTVPVVTTVANPALPTMLAMMPTAKAIADSRTATPIARDQRFETVVCVRTVELTKRRHAAIPTTDSRSKARRFSGVPNSDRTTVCWRKNRAAAA